MLFQNKARGDIFGLFFAGAQGLFFFCYIGTSIFSFFANRENFDRGASINWTECFAKTAAGTYSFIDKRSQECLTLDRFIKRADRIERTCLITNKANLILFPCYTTAFINDRGAHLGIGFFFQGQFSYRLCRTDLTAFIAIFLAASDPRYEFWCPKTIDTCF